MDSMIYNPSEEYDSRFKELHANNTKEFFESLLKTSGVDVAENQKTVQEYEGQALLCKKLRRKLNLFRFLRVLMIISLILIPVVILKMTPRIRALRAEIESSENASEQLLERAWQQTAPLCDLLTDEDALRIFEKTIPSISFSSHFSEADARNMVTNFDYPKKSDAQRSTVELLSGAYNENPFLFERHLVHVMGTEIYHGYKTIHWTETYRDSDGKQHTRVRTETLHATVIKPKPFYHTEVRLRYCAQGGPELSFTRDATHLERKSEREIERYVKKGEKRLKKLTDEAIKDNSDFTSMSNSDFEVLFDALDRTDEVQFRTLFTPLAQTNMVDLIRSQTGFGDDFNFSKTKRTNTIVTDHSRDRALYVKRSAYLSHSVDVIRESFLKKNEAFFKAVYFDFAPLWAIPLYQERPVHSLDPIPEGDRLYASEEHEALVNAGDARSFAHPESETSAILKTEFLGTDGTQERIAVSAFSYKTVQRIDFVPVHGGDGDWHNVPVPWDVYIPLEERKSFRIVPAGSVGEETVITRKNNLCILQLQ